MHERIDEKLALKLRLSYTSPRGLAREIETETVWIYRITGYGRKNNKIERMYNETNEKSVKT